MNNNFLKNRLLFFSAVCLVLFFVLAGRLFYLQIVKGREYDKKAINNRIKIVRNAAPRGIIADRNGIPIAFSRKSYTVNAVPEEIRENPESLDLLCSILNIDKAKFEEIVKEENPRPGYPVRIASGISFGQIQKLGEYRSYLNGVSLDNEYIRSYPFGKDFCHITGYTREITREALDKSREMGLDYRMGDYIGIAGLEKQYEKYLRGKDGGKRLEVNAGGSVVQILKDIPYVEGKTLVTTLDAELQKTMFQAFNGKPGAAVALDPNNGEVLAMVSSPSFDPNIFSDGLKVSDWKNIRNNRHHPLQNRFVASFYPPGSVFKPIIGLSVLKNHIADLGTYVYCPGYFKLGHYRKGCWDVHRGVNFDGAIADSCDTWFYKQSLSLGIDRLTETVNEFGLGKPTGIDLPEEVSRNGKSGRFPTREWHKKVYKREWGQGDMLNVSIGQGDVQVSPLQIALAISAVANGGTVYRPHIMKEITDPKTGQVIAEAEIFENSRVNAEEQYFSAVRKAMEGCVRNGTGKGCAVPGIRVGGKTGSAQATGGIAHGWFVAFAPVENPQIVVAAIVEHGGSGSASAAPICKAAIEKYLAKR